MGPKGQFFDGETGKRLTVDIQIERAAGLLLIRHETLEGGGLEWPLQDLRATRDDANTGALKLSRRHKEAVDGASLDVARVIVKDAQTVQELQTLCPNLFKRDLAPGTIGKMTMRLGAAFGALALMLFVIIPAMAGTLASIIPIEREIQWGKSVVSQMERFFGAKETGQLVCRGDAGLMALSKMVDRLQQNEPGTYALDVRVFNHKMVNAFAAPGGQIVFMNGLIQAASSPEEVAAVLAHEIAHVENRDATRETLRAAGSAGLLAMVIGDFAGGSLAVVMADTVLNASYTRNAEAKADEFALNMLQNAQIDTSGMAKFFDTLSATQKGPKIPDYLSSHPATEDRAAAARAFAEGQSSSTPILTDLEWKALKAICANAAGQKDKDPKADL